MTGARRSAAEEARTLVAGGRLAALATTGEDGAAWASLVGYASLADGTPIVCLSTLAEHGRNVRREPRASLLVSEPDGPGDPLDLGRVTLAGRLEVPAGEAAEAARAAYPAGYGAFTDFTYYALRVERVRWVGGYGRMGSASPAAYHAAEPDPVAPGAASALAHLNADHAHNLLDMARALAGHPDAAAARCARIDRYGLDLDVTTPRGVVSERVAFATPVSAPGGLRGATVELARRARGGVRTPNPATGPSS